ncbi:MAG: ArsR family transcriptional regulator [Nitrososphaerota archaeon]|jgi:predicted ArsR family transcriptional regulator|nr:ArsR family transcriptional regulator [Nitrososphaerota archaeon]MDG6966765.1 ArsR family transcriptional regulator [Nitrososphaerota archaeon]MDG6979174.1 ArsR family transcriptional regulator [Nitrososphaerota archaeon]MDG7005770.1 ArsR family transcriptional regulator [Nitrososphaerota archaeon]MDG7020529.1 ArsR family transcriptional regulator [Nitrososphaerota archaeon]
MEELLAERSGTPAKGWVRDGILSFLAKRPGTATEMAADLGVSKATVSYHTKALVRKGMIEILDIKSVRGGVYSKTFALKRGGQAFAGKAEEREAALTKLDEHFERLLISVDLDSRRKASEEVEIFLYHLYSLMAESGSLDEGVFEEYGRRVGEGIVAPSLAFPTRGRGLRALCERLNADGMARISAELRKGSDARLACEGCFENSGHGGLVCSFTRGILTGALKAKDGSVLRLERQRRETRRCLYVVKRRGFGR